MGVAGSNLRRGGATASGGSDASGPTHGNTSFAASRTAGGGAPTGLGRAGGAATRLVYDRRSDDSDSDVGGYDGHGGRYGGGAAAAAAAGGSQVRLPQRMFRVHANPQPEATTFGPARSIGPARPPPGLAAAAHGARLGSMGVRRGPGPVVASGGDSDDDGVVGGALALGGGGTGRSRRRCGRYRLALGDPDVLAHPAVLALASGLLLKAHWVWVHLIACNSLFRPSLRRI